jgi:hypothetical protein
LTSNIITSAVPCQLKRYLSESTEVLSYQGRENSGIFKIHYYLKIILEPMTGNIVISEVDAFMYVVLSQAKAYALLGIIWYLQKYCFLYTTKKNLLSSGLQGRNFCREQNILPADFSKIF